MIQLTDDDPFGENDFVVTENDIDQFKKCIAEEVVANPQLYHSRDVEMIRTNDEVCRRYVRHKRRDVTAAVEMAKNSLRWRNEFGVNDLGIEEQLSETSEHNIYRLYFNVGCFIPFKKDKQGSQCIIFRTKLHRKNAERSHDMKRYLVFWVEKFLYQHNHPRLTFVFDSTDASYSSMDLEQIMFTIKIFNEYYPWALGYVIVYNMPWILKTIWGGIQALIPADGADRFKFCNGEEIFQFIDRDNLPEFMGGNIAVPFRELTLEEIDSIPTDPTNIEKRHCTTPAIKKFYSDNFGLFANSVELQNADEQSTSEVFVCRPESCLCFDSSNGVRRATLELTNCSPDGRPIAFRIRTNRPDGYSAHPHSGTINYKASVQISVTKLNDVIRGSRDKLLVQVAPVEHCTFSHADFVDYFDKLGRHQICEKKILCRCVVQDKTEISPAERGQLNSVRGTDSLERRIAILTAQNHRQQLINFVLCALIVLQMAFTLHDKLCQLENNRFFC